MQPGHIHQPGFDGWHTRPACQIRRPAEFRRQRFNLDFGCWVESRTSPNGFRRDAGNNGPEARATRKIARQSRNELPYVWNGEAVQRARTSQGLNSSLIFTPAAVT